MAKKERDVRYETIRPMYEAGKVKVLNDIFRWLPKTVVAEDLGKKVSRFSALLDHVEDFSIKDLILIANYCNLTRREILELINNEIDGRRNDNNNNPSS